MSEFPWDVTVSVAFNMPVVADSKEAAEAVAKEHWTEQLDALEGEVDGHPVTLYAQPIRHVRCSERGQT